MVNYIWALKFLPGVMQDMKKLTANHTLSMEFYKDVIRHRRSTYQPGDDKDVLDNYLSVEYERDEPIVNFGELMPYRSISFVNLAVQRTISVIIMTNNIAFFLFWIQINIMENIISTTLSL